MHICASFWEHSRKMGMFPLFFCGQSVATRQTAWLNLSADRMKRALLTITFLSLCGLLRAAGDIVWLISPNKQLYAALYLDSGKIKYRVAAANLTLINNAELGLRVDNRTIGANVQQLRLLGERPVKRHQTSRLNDRLSWNNYIEYAVAIQQQDGTDTLHFRVYDNGCAFRYIIAGEQVAMVHEELTTFTFPANAQVWYFERNNNWKLKSYAGWWTHTTPDQLPVISQQGPIQGKPLVAELPGKKYMVITEAALHGYSGMRLKATGNNTVQVNFTEGAAGFSVNKKLVTPWRVILFAKDLNELVKNKVIEHLNPAPDRELFPDMSWIKPGIAVWSWITRNERFLEPEEEKKFIDAAAALNFQYSLIDEGWETKWPDKWKQLKELCAYAAKKKVGIWVWRHSDLIRDTTQRNRFLDSIRDCGVVGLKTDFMNSEAKGLIDFEIGLLTATAQRKIMVNFHGCQAPTGESVTFPNELTREGIRGMELNSMNEPIPAWHNAALPFTRFICGHGDYTPAFFSNKANTTYTHQLALLYLFNSPFQCIAENPVTLLNEPRYKPILPLLKTLPVTWDQTVVLNGSDIGRMAAFARRKGREWYVAVINGTDQAMSFRLNPNDFLWGRKPYNGTMIGDDTNGDGFITSKLMIETGTVANFQIPANGGLVIHIKSNYK